MQVRILTEPITRAELKAIANEGFGDLVKAAVDVERRIVAVGGELHSDEEVELVEKMGSRGVNVWGINLYPDKQGEEFIEFDSMINLKPALGNRMRGVDDESIRKKIVEVVQSLVR